jgi:O-antigen/teichoic acid export membrane protein
VRSSLVGRTSWSALATTLTFGSRFLAGVVCARILGPEEVGRLFYLLWMAELLSSLTFLALQTTMTRYVADLRGQGRDAAAGALAHWLARWHLALVLVGAAVILAVGSRTHVVGDGKLLWTALAAYLALHGWGALYIAWLEGTQRFDVSARLNLMAGVALALGAAVGAVAGGLGGAMAGYIVGAAVPAVAGWRRWLTEPAVGGVDADMRRRVARYAASAWLAAVISVLVWSRSEFYFLERFWGAEAVAMFGVALALATLATQLPALLSGALLAHFASHSATADRDAVRGTYAAGTRFAALFGFPISLIGASVASPLLTTVYGDRFASAGAVATILLAFSALGVANVGSALLYGLERASFIALGGLLGAALFVAGALLVIPQWGPAGAAWTRGLVQLSMVALGTWYIARRLECEVPFRAVGRTLVAAGGAGLVALVAGRWAVGAPGLLSGVGAAGLTYVLLLRLTRAVEPADAEILRNAVGLLSPPFAAPVRSALLWLAPGG